MHSESTAVQPGKTALIEWVSHGKCLVASGGSAQVLRDVITDSVLSDPTWTAPKITTPGGADGVLCGSPQGFRQAYIETNL
jgi:hypothetical protein